MTGRPAKSPPTVRTCRKCGETKGVEEFMTTGKMTGANADQPQRRNTCKACWAQKAKDTYAKSHEDYKAQMVDEAPEGMKTCRECGEVYPETPEFFSSDRRYGTSSSYCRNCLKKRTKAYYDTLRLEVLRHYGGGQLRCMCPGCTEANPAFLSLDHIHGGGSAHRREIGTSGSRLFLRLKLDGYPSGYQTLCFNCNLGRQFHGGPDHQCPHVLAQDQSSHPEKGSDEPTLH